MCMPLTRRELLRRTLHHGGRTLLAGTAVAALGSLHPVPAQAFDPRSWFGADSEPAKATVKVLKGRAYAGKRRLAVGDTIASGTRVSVEQGGRAVIAAGDGSIFQVYGGATVELLLNMMRQGLLHLLQGALLAVVPLGNTYVAQGTTALVGIKGTVFYHQVFGPEPAPGRTMDGTVPIPSAAREYFCLCHGEVDYYRRPGGEPFFTDRGEHHSAHFLEPERPGVVAPAPMMNHDDEDILRLIALQAPPRHDASWIEGRRMALPR